MKTLTILLITLSLFISACYVGPDVIIADQGLFDLTFGDSVHDFSVTSIEGLEIPLSLFTGEVLLIVNTATECGLTYQLEGLQEIREKYRHYNFEVLAFPSNNFANQEPRTNEEILEFCRGDFGVEFSIFAKLDVIGEDQHPLFGFLVNNAPYEEMGADIEWNFAKFLIDRDGTIHKRYHPEVEPEDIAQDIEMLLGLI